MILYKCPKCGYKEEVGEPMVLNCDHCCSFMVRQLEVRKQWRISKRDQSIIDWHIAQKMKEIFGHRRWMDDLVNPFKLKKISISKNRLKIIKR